MVTVLFFFFFYAFRPFAASTNHLHWSFASSIFTVPSTSIKSLFTWSNQHCHGLFLSGLFNRTFFINPSSSHHAQSALVFFLSYELLNTWYFKLLCISLVFSNIWVTYWSINFSLILILPHHLVSLATFHVGCTLRYNNMANIGNTDIILSLYHLIITFE